MNLISKVGILVLGGAASTVCAYTGINYLKKNKPSVSEHLRDHGYKLISASIDNEGHRKLQWEEEFKSDREKIKALIEFTGNSDVEGGRSLEKWCSSKLKENYSEDIKDLSEVKSYCALRNIESQLSRNGSKRILTRDSGDDDKWDKTYEQRKKTTQLSPRSQVNLDGTWPVGPSADTKTQDLTKIKNWCELKVKSYFLAYESTYTHVYNWCTEDGVNVNESQKQ